MKTALVYDRVNKWGGAERILLELHELFPNAPLYTSVYNPETAAWAKVFNIKTSFLQKIKFARTRHEILALLMPLAFESFNFDEYDLVISVTSEAAKGIITKPSTVHICYCLTPTRYLWSGYDQYFGNKLLRTTSKPVINYLRKWDIKAASRPNAYIAISKEVQNRIKKYYKRDAELVYPPVGISNVPTSPRLRGASKFQVSNVKSTVADKFFLVVSRLVPYKRIDLAIQACNELKLPLVIIGTGSEKKKLQKIAGQTIQFKSNLTDIELMNYYKKCSALIFPGVEDFGLVMAEAMSFGKPVIAYKAGGALEIVDDNITGILFNTQTKQSLVNVLKDFNSKDFNSKEIKKRSQVFNNIFRRNFMEVVNDLYKKLNYCPAFSKI